MILGLPLAIWFGILTITSLFITAAFAIAKSFKNHRIFAFITIILAIVHSILAYLLWFKGISI